MGYPFSGSFSYTNAFYDTFAPDTSYLYPCPPRQPTFSRRSGHLRGQERCWRGIGDRKSPVSFQPPPRGANKIYICDVVFYIGENNTNNQSKPQFPYLPPRGANKIYKCDVVFSIGEAKINNPSKTSFPHKIMMYAEAVRQG